jgi:murein L,D-transpeptidase YcbB/YkuD
MPLSLASLRNAPTRTLVAVAALIAGPIAVAAVAATGNHPHEQPATGSAPAAAPVVQAGSSAEAVEVLTAAAGLGQCQSARLVPVGNGWGIPVPSVWESSSTDCNLRYGDKPNRGSEQFGDPDTAIRTLQRNLNYCYGSHLAVDGIYGSNTRAVVKAVQRQHKLTADGVYGPKTRSAMTWRMYLESKGLWSTGCYSPL